MIALFAALTLVPQTAQAGEVRRRALLVGANDGGGELEPLRYAEDDAGEMAQVLIDLGGFEPYEVEVLLSPSREVLLEALEFEQSVSADGESLFVFYYSGHADARGLRLGEQIYDYADLKADIRLVPADVHLGILDACRAGAITRVKGAKVSAPFLVDEPLGSEGEAWLAATSEHEDAQESDSIGGSFFTHYLLSGLRGAADSGDGEVSLNEAYTYAYSRTVARTGGTEGGTQHPAYDFRLQGNGDLRLTDVSRGDARVRFPAEMAGEITVLRMPEGDPVAEVAKREGQPIALALSPGRYKLRHRGEDGLQEATLNLTDGADHHMDRWGEVVAERANPKGKVLAIPVGGLPSDGELGDAAEAVAVASGGTVDGAGPPELGASGDPASDLPADATPSQPEDGSASSPSDEIEPEGDREAVTPSSPRDDVEPEVDREAVTLSTLPGFPEVIDEVRRIPQRFELRDNPFIAGTFSALLPGAGQAYNDQWGRGALFLGGTVTATAIGWGVTGNQAQVGGGLASGLTGPNFGTLLGAAMYGWAIADAAWQADDPMDFRKETGVDLSIDAAWSARRGLQDPYASGISVDWVFRPNLSFGLDRVGYVRHSGGLWEVSGGGRFAVAPEWDRFRPAAYVSAGLRGGSAQLNGRNVRRLLGVGTQLRFYATPRYFLQFDSRLESDGGELIWNGGGGLGVHFGG